MSLNNNLNKILIIDFGSQYTQLIARRVRELNVYCEIFPYDAEMEKISAFKPSGIILSGGPNSVYKNETPNINAHIFELGIPILGICYGMQTIANQLGGKVELANKREFGHADLKLRNQAAGLFKGISKKNISLWMSHLEHVSKLTNGFIRNGSDVINFSYRNYLSNKVFPKLDQDLIEISVRSLQVTLSALVISSLFALPLAAVLAVKRFKFRRFIIALLNALMGLPPVVVGLIVYILLSRSGPFGVLDLLYTTAAMVIAQIVIITPLITSIAHQSLRELWSEYHDLLISMNTSHMQRIKTLLWDARRALLTASLAGFGRAIGEVGAIMIVGGNIDNATRVLTTAIALETSKGDFALALALGFVLILIAIALNLATHWLSKTEREGRW